LEILFEARENKKVKLFFNFCHSNTVRREQMKKSSLRRAMVALCAFGLLSMGMAGAVYAQKGPAAGNPKAKGDPKDVTTQGDISYKGVAATSLKGRIFGHWADNPDGEILFGIQYWNTTAPAEVGDPPGRASDDRIQTLPETMASCCAWGYQGGAEKNAAYDGWYTPQTTVRLVVKDKALMDQMTKASQDLVAMELQVSGHTVTSFKILN
jgi:hypothetical protein